MTMLFDQDYATKVMLNESRQEGKLEGILSVAKEMLLNGISTDLIAKVTNISDEELNKMKTELALT